MKEHKHLGAWGDSHSNHLPGLFGYMAPRLFGMVLALVGIVLIISFIQWVCGMSPTLLQELYMQLKELWMQLFI
jgi:hypothetical protein